MKIVKEIETKYDKGDYVMFQKNNDCLCGQIVGFNLDNDYVWYNIQVNEGFTFTYSNGGDIAEWDIVCKLTPEQIEKVKDIIS